MGPGKPVQLMMSLYNAFGKGDKVEIAKDKVVFMTEPKDEIKSSYEQNTSKILTPNKGLITETKFTKLMVKVNFIRDDEVISTDMPVGRTIMESQRFKFA